LLGIKATGFDGRGNYNLGGANHFPEIDKVNKISEWIFVCNFCKNR
jgi:ribosomal protein L5